MAFDTNREALYTSNTFADKLSGLCKTVVCYSVWGNSILVPPKVQSKVFEVLQSTHPGVSQNEESGQKLNLVARHGCYHWEPS